jgi:photosystem II stability/assembly factor-like uncharacterized protein
MKTVRISGIIASTWLVGITVCQPLVPSFLTYQGRVQTQGTDFTGTGWFKLALVDAGQDTSRTAAARAEVSDGIVLRITMLEAGSGYQAPPKVSITGLAGSGARAEAVVSRGQVVRIDVLDGGEGYVGAQVSIDSPPPSLAYITYWSNDGTSVAGGEPANAVPVTVANGLFTLPLGDSTLADMTPLSADVFVHPAVHLRLWFSDGAHGFAQLRPDQPLGAAPYAFAAQKVNEVIVDTADLVDGSVTAAKLAPGAVFRLATPDGAQPGALQVNNDGYIGIGTDLPGAALHVVGDLVVKGDSVQLESARTELGWETTASADYATAMGRNSTASGLAATAAGSYTTASGAYAVALGRGTTASGYAAVASGDHSTATKSGSFAAGTYAHANHNGAFVWADSSSGSGFSSTDRHQFLIRATGGVGIGTNRPQSELHVAGTITADAVAAGAIIGQWEEVTDAFALTVPNRGYLAQNSDEVTFILPLNPAVGDIVRVSGPGAGGWTVLHASGQRILTRPLGGIGAFWHSRESTRSWRSVASSVDGTKLVAVAHGGRIYTSANSGGSWTPRDANRSWTDVACSDDGTRLIACANYDFLYVSQDSGVTWTPRDPDTYWSAVACSSDGLKMVAVSEEGWIFTSVDAGATWHPRDLLGGTFVDVASSANGIRLVTVCSDSRMYTSSDAGTNWVTGSSAEAWRAVDCSRDGYRLVAVGGRGQIHLSTDAGVTWRARGPIQRWRGVASSADGAKLVAVAEDGQVHTSADAGTTWVEQPSGYRDWISVACSANGANLLAAANGGRLYTSVPTTNTGLEGEAGSSIELQYVGNGSYLPLSYAGRIAPK